MKFQAFSEKQRLALTWWCPQSPYCAYDAIICDGAVRSGKTCVLSFAFVLWASVEFSGQNFALCGKTRSALTRNLVEPLKELLGSIGFEVVEKSGEHLLLIRMPSGGWNRFYLFGGKDEGAASLIQGMTLAGVFFDEVALMPKSFVDQALARCSVNGSRFWFNCNPENPYHWFYTEWIQKREEKRAYYLHFTMEDNPALSPDIRARYAHLYSGVFYRRYVLGEWVHADGLVYPMFSKEQHVYQTHPRYERYYISVDYGTVNPCSMGLWGLCRGRWYRMRECYYASRREGVQKTDEQYYRMLETLAGTLPVEAVIVDPSAASFLACIREHGRFTALPAKNDVLSGIRAVCGALQDGRICIHESCTDTLREFGQYVWQSGALQDAPKKEHDHAMDDIRYFVSTILQQPSDGFFVASAARS